MGFHLREYREAEGDETEMFSARIYQGDDEVGSARSSGMGAPVVIDIRPEYRWGWKRLTRYMEEHPVTLQEGGMRMRCLSADEAAMIILRDLHGAERSLSRSRKYRSGLVGYVWEQPFPGAGWWATAHLLFSAAEAVSAEDADRGLFRILVLGTDNEHFAREEAPLPASGTA